ncbi:MAG TPA: SDR family oxidoreductase [Ignavibacteria bacterium]|nr:SDR family oxidoreductase [Ignavibacteria bacterium]
MTDRVAIVTGGTGALGRVVSEKLAHLGIKIYIPSRSLDTFNKVFDNSQNENSEDFNLKKIFSFECDITNEASVIEFVKNVAVQEKGKIDFLINTAGGIDSPVNTGELSTSAFMKMLDLNFMTAFYFSREVLNVMLKNNYGRIISFGSKSATELTPKKFAYSYSKLGVIQLMNILGEEYKKNNIRCNTIIPGIIDTPSNREWGTAEDVKSWTKPGDIAEIISDVISDKYISLRNSELKLYNSF